MDTWFSYRLSDFILFSERVYWRLFDQVNDLAGAFLTVLIALGCLLLVGVWSRHRAVRNATAMLLGAFWVSSAILFLWFYYTPVNWAARYAVPFFFLEAGLLILLSFTGQLSRSLHKNDVKGWLGFVLLAYAVVIHPFTSLMFGRTLASAEIVGLAPDATAMATLGVVLVTATTRALYLLLPIPVLALTLSGLTLHALGTAEAWVIPVALLVTVAALASPKLPVDTGNTTTAKAED
ncbi:MAG TPA: DUF6064 family protein [Saccharospirillum sp.]|nr:DUF6064 family protein [Saccharospirillum sp.]